MTNPISGHAWDRIRERLTPVEQEQVQLRAALALKHADARSFAIRLLILPRQRNEAWSDVSNGDEVWGIVRDREMRTVMLRRSTQPATAAAMRVDYVV